MQVFTFNQSFPKFSLQILIGSELNILYFQFIQRLSSSSIDREAQYQRVNMSQDVLSSPGGLANNPVSMLQVKFVTPSFLLIIHCISRSSASEKASRSPSTSWSRWRGLHTSPASPSRSSSDWTRHSAPASRRRRRNRLLLRSVKAFLKWGGNL